MEHQTGEEDREVTIPLPLVFEPESQSLDDYLEPEEIDDLKDALDLETAEEVEEWFNKLEIERSHRGRVADQHLQSAISLSREVERIEQTYDRSWGENPPKENGANIIVKHRSLVISTIISTVSFLETLINEEYDRLLVYQQQEDAIFDYEDSEQIDEELTKYLNRMDQALHQEIERKVTFLNKYQLILSMSGCDGFDQGKNPWQDVNTLRRLRNYFVHYTPEEYTSSSEDDEINHDLGSAIQGKFGENPLIGPSHPFFPNQALSYGCTRWCISAAIEFTDEFYNRLDHTPKYRKNDTIALEQYL